MNILFISCSCGYNKLLAYQYKQQGFEVRALNMNPIWRTEAKAYGLKLPFKVVDGIVSKV